MRGGEASSSRAAHRPLAVISAQLAAFVVGGKSRAGSLPTLRGDAIWVEKTESASAIVYLEGSTFAWYQQGD